MRDWKALKPIVETCDSDVGVECCVVVEGFGGFEAELVVRAEETDVAGSGGEGEVDDVGGEEVGVD